MSQTWFTEGLKTNPTLGTIMADTGQTTADHTWGVIAMCSGGNTGVYVFQKYDVNNVPVANQSQMLSRPRLPSPTGISPSHPTTGYVESWPKAWKSEMPTPAQWSKFWPILT